MAKNYDAIVIGTGQAGPPLAERLGQAGWKVAVIWECGTRNSKEFLVIISQLNKFIKDVKATYYESTFKKK